MTSSRYILLLFVYSKVKEVPGARAAQRAIIYQCEFGEVYRPIFDHGTFTIMGFCNKVQRQACCQQEKQGRVNNHE
jgi:hypothetical protein